MQTLEHRVGILEKRVDNHSSEIGQENPIGDTARVTGLFSIITKFFKLK